MNAYQEAKLNMYRATEQHCDENSTIISQTPAFQNAFNNFKAKIADLITTTQLTEVALEGITAGKTTTKKELCTLAADISGIIFAFASIQNNEALKAESNYSFSALFKTRDDELSPRCQNIHDRGVENLADLADYGITAAKLEELETAIRDYSQVVPKPRTARAARKTQTQNLKTLFAEADEILKDQMDKLVVTFKVTNPDFVETYRSARIIIDPATTTTELRGTITANTDGTEIQNATIEIVELSKSTTSNSVGYYQIKPVEIGTYTIKVTADGYQEIIANDVEFKLGVTNRLDLELF